MWSYFSSSIYIKLCRFQNTYSEFSYFFGKKDSQKNYFLYRYGDLIERQRKNDRLVKKIIYLYVIVISDSEYAF